MKKGKKLWQYVAVMCCLMIATSVCQAQNEQKPSGDGSETSPYQISNADELYWFMEFVNSGNTSANAELTKDITINKGVLNPDGTLNEDEKDNFREWFPIGYYYKDKNSVEEVVYYSGTFDGKGFTISGLYFNNPKQECVGLFGQNSGTIQNVGVVDSYFYGGGEVGGVCGYNYYGTITNCYNSGSVYGNENSYYMGGVCGFNYGGNAAITNCYNTGSVFGNQNIGGVCGFCSESASITNCYNTGSVFGSEDIGGVCGYIKFNSILTNCYNTGSVFGSEDIGGVCGDNDYATITNCYYNNENYTGNTIGSVKSSQQFNSGEVAYLLSQGENGDIWGQDLTDEYSYPELNGPTVHEYIQGYFYGNDGTIEWDEDGFCDYNGKTYYQKPTQDGNGVYQIANAGQLYWFMEFVNSETDESNYANAILTDNITVNEGVLAKVEAGNVNDLREWFPIGYYICDEVAEEDVYYFGTFDGKGFTISGLYFNNPKQEYVGLFGQNKGTIKNVGVVDSYFYGQTRIGGVCGYNDGGTIDNCQNIGTVENKGSFIGGICGYNNGGKIVYCHNFGLAENSYYKFYYDTYAGKIGGICGLNSSGTISYCSNSGHVESESSWAYSYAGGICGCNEDGHINNCYNTGSVYASYYYAGGVCGYNTCGDIDNCYNIAIVDGYYCVGGVVGFNAGNVSNSYNVGQIIGSYDSSGDVCGGGDDNVVNCYYLGSVDEGMSKTASQFKNGEVAYLLNRGQYKANFFQTIGVDTVPTLSHLSKQVYVSTCCGVEIDYLNVPGIKYTQHDFAENGICRHCGALNGVPVCIDGVYQIAKASDLYWFMEYVNNGYGDNNKACAVLVNDIVVNENVLNADGTLNGDGSRFRQWTPIGCYYYHGILIEDVCFKGKFNGKGHVISGLFINDTTQRCVGLFGRVSGATIDSVGIVDSYFKANYNVGGLIGYCQGIANSTVVSNCYSASTVIGVDHTAATGSGLSHTGSYVGGICGYNEGAAICNCYNLGELHGSQLVGGLCGGNDGVVKNSYNAGIVKGKKLVGGLCGDNVGKLVNCHNVGYIVGENAGGLCEENKGSVVNCYYLAGRENILGGKSSFQFQNGEVAYLLNGNQDTITFRQTIGKDKYPVCSRSSKQVHKVKCVDVVCYSNGTDNFTEHDYVDGVCSHCGTMKEPELLNGIYQIANANDLYWFMEYVNKCKGDNNKANAVLTADIIVNKNVLNEDGSLNGDGSKFRKWFPIGYSSICKETKSGDIKDEIYFKGTFNGNGHVVSGLFFDDMYQESVGLFGLVDSAKIENLGVVDSYFRANYNVGGLCGNVSDTASFFNCFNSSTLYAVEGAVGGMCGYAEKVSIANCYNSGSISSKADEVGGLCGSIKYGTMAYCYNTGFVSGDSIVGGLIGLFVHGAVTNSYNVGDVCGDTKVGVLYGKNGGVFGNCYYVDDVENGSGAKTDSQFRKGVVAYLLNGNQDSIVFMQSIGSDNYPVLDKSSKQVYKVTCAEGIVCYLNENINYAEHNFVDGICSHCGKYKTPEVKDNVFQISNANELYWFVEYVNNGMGGNSKVSAELTEDIVVNKNVLKADGTLNDDCSGFRRWFPIGFYYDIDGDGNVESVKFKGSFNGNGHTISGLYSDNESQKYVGLFGLVDSARIENVGIIDSYFKGVGFVGGLCGKVNDTASILNCFNLAYICAEIAYAGGLCGYIQNCYIANSFNTGIVSSNQDCAGGLCAFAYVSNFSKCYNTGNVTAEYKYIGGLCGDVESSVIENCYNTGTTRGYEYVGGLCGSTKQSVISKCYSIGRVYAPDYEPSVGGLLGRVGNDSIANCFYNSDICKYGAIYNNDNVAQNAVGKPTVAFADKKLISDFDCGEWSEGDLVEGVNAVDVKYPYLSSFGEKSQYVGNVKFEVVGVKKDYLVGEWLNLAIGKVVMYNDDIKSEIDLSSDRISIVKTPDMGKTAENAIVSILVDSMMPVSFNINVHAVSVGMIAILDNSFDLSCYVGDDLDLTNAKIEVILNNDHIAGVIPVTANMISGFDKDSVGYQEFHVNYEGVYDIAGIDVMPIVIESISLLPNSFPESCFVGDELDFSNAKINAVCNDKRKSGIFPVTADMISGFDSTKAGIQKIYVIYCGDTVTTTINVRNIALKSVSFLPNSFVKSCYVGDVLDFSNAKLVLAYNNVRMNDTIDVNPEMISGFDNMKAGKQFVVCTYQGKVAKSQIFVNPVKIESMTLSQNSFVDWLYVGDELDLSKANLTVKYNDARKDTVVAVTNDMISGFGKNTAGKQVIHVTYQNHSVNDTIEVVAVLAESISLVDNAFAKSCYVGDSLDLSNAKIDVVYNDVRKNRIINVTDVMISGFDCTKAGIQTITVTYQKKTATAEIEVLKPVSINADVASVAIYAHNRTIVVETSNIDDSDIFVFDVNGRMVAKQRVNSSHVELEMQAQGMYIVRVGEKTTRVILQ